MDYSRQRIEVAFALELLWLAAIVLVALAQSMLLPRPLELTLNVVLLLVTCRALLGSIGGASVGALLGGVALDLATTLPLGTHALALVLAVGGVALGMALGVLGRLRVLLATVFGGVLYHSVLLAATTWTTGPMPFSRYALVTALPDMALILTGALPVFLLRRRDRELDLGALL